MKLVDLTQTWCNLTPTWPYFPSSKVWNFHSHHRDGVWSQIIETNMHSGTHVDAPAHNNPTGWDMAQVPLERLYGTGLVVDLSDQVQEYTIITRQMVEKALVEPIRKDDIVILYYGWKQYNWEGENADEVKYFCKCPGPAIDLVDYLIEKGIKWVGTDCPSFEHPFQTAIRDYRPDLVAEMEERYGRPIEELLPRKNFLAAHRRMFKHNIMHVDNIGGDVHTLVGRRVTIGAFPWRWHRGDASICRLVAFLDD